jgi:hypothetical protein
MKRKFYDEAKRPAKKDEDILQVKVRMILMVSSLIDGFFNTCFTPASFQRLLDGSF